MDEPLPGAGEVLADSSHPAIVHFDDSTKAQIRHDLGDATVREVGYAMIRVIKGREGMAVTNAVYNAAANLTTAVLGGPESLTAKIHARTPGARDLTVRRYMLAARDVTGDNTATAEGLAAVLRGMATANVSGLDVETVGALREVMYQDDDPLHGRHFYKGGSLNSDPQCRIVSGWYERNDAVLVYAIMAEESAGERPGQSGLALQQLVENLRERLMQGLEW